MSTVPNTNIDALREMIFKRRSCRSYTGLPVDTETVKKIRSFSMTPLYPDIRVHMEIVRRDQVKCICPWTTPQLIAIYSEEKEGYLENIGFMFQQMDLYLQSLGLGACWLGMGRMHAKTAPQVDGMKFAILLAFGNPKGDLYRKETIEFKRKRMEQIADRADPALEPARLAPSSVNSQPWYFVHEGDTLHVYCVKKGLTGYMNRMDIGIALAHLYVSHAESFCFFQSESASSIPGYGYIGSVRL